MVFLSGDPKAARPLARFLRVGTVPSWADLVAFVLLAAAAILVVRGAEDMSQSLAVLHTTPVTLDSARLPEYALCTTLRMFLALGASLVFTFTVATLAAKSRKAELIIVPALDILQSVPVLGFLTFTVSFFMGLFPAASWASSARRSSPSSPARPGTWPSASTSRCARSRRTWTRSAVSSPSRPGGGSCGWSCRSPRLAWCGT
jgi:hypothetical protein